jgi:hypothetical protein
MIQEMDIEKNTLSFKAGVANGGNMKLKDNKLEGEQTQH